MYKLVYFVPESHLEITKAALFAAGAGQYQHYDQCCWQTLGRGQFRPLENAKPYLGVTHSLTQVEEYRVELICEDDYIHQSLMALRAVHPYEEPAIDVWRLESFI